LLEHETSRVAQSLKFVACILEVPGSKFVRNTNCSESGFGGLEVARWPLVPKFASSHPAETVRIFRAEKNLSTLSFGVEVKPSVPGQVVGRVAGGRCQVQCA